MPNEAHIHDWTPASDWTASDGPAEECFGCRGLRIVSDGRASSVATLVPLTLAQARRYVADHHRHNEPPIGHRFSIGLRRGDELVGVVIAGHPVARKADDGLTIELLRVTTEGDRNACSRLYSAACRAAAAMGYRKAITYTLAEESGTSLRASGFTESGTTAGHNGWATANRPLVAEEMPRLFDPPKMPAGPKVRWVRELGRALAARLASQPDPEARE